MVYQRLTHYIMTSFAPLIARKKSNIMSNCAFYIFLSGAGFSYGYMLSDYQKKNGSTPFHMPY